MLSKKNVKCALRVKLKFLCPSEAGLGFEFSGLLGNLFCDNCVNGVILLAMRVLEVEGR